MSLATTWTFDTLAVVMPLARKVAAGTSTIISTKSATMTSIKLMPSSLILFVIVALNLPPNARLSGFTIAWRTPTESPEA
jgi:hypothetical protein